jgi:hypothetical protein
MTPVALNDFFATSSDGERALLLHGGKAYTKGVVARLIGKAAMVAAGMPGRECILHAQDGLRFVIGFFALLHSGKDVILASNVRENTLGAIGTRNVLSDVDLVLRTSNKHATYPSPDALPGGEPSGASGAANRTPDAAAPPGFPPRTPRPPGPSARQVRNHARPIRRRSLRAPGGLAGPRLET